MSELEKQILSRMESIESEMENLNKKLDTLGEKLEPLFAFFENTRILTDSEMEALTHAYARAPNGVLSIILRSNIIDNTELGDIGIGGMGGRGKGSKFSQNPDQDLDAQKSDQELVTKSESTSKRRSKKQDQYTQEEIDLSKTLVQLIGDAHSENKDWFKKMRNRSVKEVHKMLKHYDAKTLYNAVEWAMQDSFWSEQIYGLAGLNRPSKSQPDQKKIDLVVRKMRASEQSESEKVEKLIQKFVMLRYEEKSDRDAVLDDVKWFQEKVSDFKPVEHIATWQYSEKMLVVLKWLTKLESSLIKNPKYKTWADVMSSYFDYLETRVFTSLKNRANIGAGWFKYGDAFRRFQDELEDQMGYAIFGEE